MIRFAPVIAAAGLIFAWSTSSASAQITIPTVPIGNPGNAPDPTTGFGSVAYMYRIGRTEVTNAQYTAFLNAVAASDTFNLYNTSMAGSLGGITRSGSPGSYVYATVSGRANNPVTFVSFWDACRFANWLHNGQPTGMQGSSTTETGAYTLGGVTNPVNASVTRAAGWRWAVASENEWYKAAYHQRASAGGDSDNYWLYPTSSNSINTSLANYDNAIGNTAPVGSYAANFYGAFDMGGNVPEWNEAIIEGSSRGVRGGSFNLGADALRAISSFSDFPFEHFPIGFRVSFVCRADFNGVGGITVQDFFDFLAAYFAADPRANFNGDCCISVQDIFDFLAAWFQGC